MKIRERALALILSMMMVLAFMPALAFAEGEASEADNTVTVDETSQEQGDQSDHTGKSLMHSEPEVDAFTANGMFDPDATAELILAEGRSLVYDGKINFPVEGDKVIITYSDDTTKTYTCDDEGDLISGDDEYLRWNYNTPMYGDTSTRFYVWDYAETFEIGFDVGIKVTFGVISISFSPATINVWGPSILDTDTLDDGTKISYYNIAKRYNWNYPDGYSNTYEFAPGDTIAVKYSDGSVKTYKCGIMEEDGYYDAWFICGDDYDWPELDFEGKLVPGNNAATIWFQGCKVPVTIFVDTPEQASQRSAVQAANQAAIAEAARQGTPDGSLPIVKISKPKAAKKAVTAKWKKLNKKQLKKGVTKIEIWVCPNKAFGAADTKIVIVGKKKASGKVKGLAKGTYFLKVRAIKNAGGVKYVGAWSKTKKIKVKK